MTYSESLDRQERRASTRQACLLQARYRAVERKGAPEWHPASVVDLSGRGCRLRVGEDLPRGAQLQMVFGRPGEGETPPLEVEVSGAVIWSRLEGLSHQTGIQFAQDAPRIEALFDRRD